MNWTLKRKIEKHLDSLEECLTLQTNIDCFQQMKENIVEEMVNENKFNLPSYLHQKDINYKHWIIDQIPNLYLLSFDIHNIEELIGRHYYYSSFKDEEYKKLVQKKLIHKKFKLDLTNYDDDDTPEKLKNYIGMSLLRFQYRFCFKRLDKYFTEILLPIYDDHKFIFLYYQKIYHKDENFFVKVTYKHENIDIYGKNYTTENKYYLKNEFRKSTIESLEKFFHNPWPTEKDIQKFLL